MHSFIINRVDDEVYMDAPTRPASEVMDGDTNDQQINEEQQQHQKQQSAGHFSPVITSGRTASVFLPLSSNAVAPTLNPATDQQQKLGACGLQTPLTPEITSGAKQAAAIGNINATMASLGNSFSQASLQPHSSQCMFVPHPHPFSAELQTDIEDPHPLPHDFEDIDFDCGDLDLENDNGYSFDDIHRQMHHRNMPRGVRYHHYNNRRWFPSFMSRRFDRKQREKTQEWLARMRLVRPTFAGNVEPEVVPTEVASHDLSSSSSESQEQSRGSQETVCAEPSASAACAPATSVPEVNEDSQ